MSTKRWFGMTLAAALTLTAAHTTMACDNDNTQAVYSSVNIYSSFPGGRQGLVDYMTANLHYPDSAAAAGIEGKVLLEFIVEKDGSVNEVTVLRSVDPLLDNEAVRLCKNMPRFKTARDADTGEPIRVRYTLPVNFKL